MPDEASRDWLGNEYLLWLWYQLDAESDKVAFDLRINVAELIGGEEGGIVVETASGRGREFKVRGGFA